MTASSLRDSIDFQESGNANALTLQQLGAVASHACAAVVVDPSTGVSWGGCGLHSAKSKLAAEMERDTRFRELTERGDGEIDRGEYSSIADIKRRFGDV